MAENKKKFRINIFDIVIILIVVCVGAGVYFLMNRGTAVNSSTKKLTYMIELNNTTPGLEDYIRIGDDLTENTKNYNMGKVVDFETIPYTKITPDYENNRFADSVDPSHNTVLITVEANVTETASAYSVDGQFVVRAGTEIFVKGEGYAGEGYIVKVIR